MSAMLSLIKAATHTAASKHAARQGFTVARPPSGSAGGAHQIESLIQTTAAGGAVPGKG